MKKARKLLLGLILFCIPVLTAAAVLPVHAEQEASEAILSGSCGTNLTYTLNSDGVLTISGTGAMASGWKNTKGKRAPWAEDAYKAQVRTVVIEEGVTDIGEYAFYQCGVTSITLPSTLTEIKKEAFDGCANLETITIPESVTAIGNYAFTGCKALTEISFPSGLKTLGTNVLQNCTGLTTFTMPAAIKSVPNNTFRGCTGLTSVTLAEGTIAFGSYAFSGCTGFTSFTIPETVKTLGTYAFSGCTGLTEMRIPAAVTTLPASLFSGCTGLTSAELAGKVTSIGASAFSGCTGFTSFSIPETVKTLGASAFANCTGLTEVTIPAAVTALPASVFSGCTGLTSVTLPETVTSIGDKAFSGAGLKEIMIPASVKTIGKNVFEKNASLTAVTFPANMTTVMDYMFSGCTALEKVVLPETVTAINGYAFQGCIALKEISMPGVTSIGGSAFVDCSAMENLELPSGLTTIQSSAFKNCTSMKKLTLPGTLSTIKSNAFQDCTGLEEVEAAEGITTIGELAFYNCTGLKKIILPSTFTDLNPRAFYKCSGLTEAELKGDQLVLADQGIYSADKKTLLMWLPGAEGTAKVTDGTETIGTNAFNYCEKITEVTLPDGLQTISASAFDYCTALESIVIPETVTSIEKQAFRSTALKEITIPSGIKTIPTNLFASCLKLERIVLPEGLEKLETGAFVACKSLKSITLPSTVTTIGAQVFMTCESLKDIELPEKVTAIPSNLFKGCLSLETITLPEGLTSIASSAFQSCTNLSFVYYRGTEEQMAAVKVTATNNAPYLDAVHICSYQGLDESLEAAVIKTQPVPASYQQNAEAEALSLEITPKGEEGEQYYFNWFCNSENSTSGGTKMTAESDSVSSKTTPLTDTLGTSYYYCAVTRVVNGHVSKTVYSDVVPIAITIPLNGKGIESAPYELSKAEDLELLYELVKNGNDLSGIYFLMTEDITLPENWKPIGVLAEGATNAGGGKNMLPFGGTIDGGNHTLTVAEGGLPLLGYVRGAVVRNLNIYGKRIEGCGLVNNYVRDYGPDGGDGNEFNNSPIVTLTADHVTLKAGSATRESGLIGEHDSTTTSASGRNHIYLTNCVVEKGVTIGYNKDEESIGSFVGRLNGTLNNCVSYADVYGSSRVGGLVGIKDTSMGKFSIKNSAFLGTVHAAGDYAGGILGSGYPSGTAPNTPCVTVVNCYAAGSVTGNDYVGGIVGAEPVVSQCWSNGIGYILNNHFAGTITAADNASYVGGTIGYIKSLNCYTNIENNYYLEGCGAVKGVGGVLYVDTSAEHETESGAIYFSTAGNVAGCPDVYGCTWQVNSNRTDDPLGADADKLSAAETAEAFRDGTILSRLNGYADGYHNWIQPEGSAYPVLSKEPVAYALEIEGTCKTQYQIGEELDLTGLSFKAFWSDETVSYPKAEELTVTGFDSTERGEKEVVFTFGSATAKITVTVLAKTTAEDEKAAAEVIARIQALPETEALTLADKDAVETAKTAYEALTSEQKSLVGEELKTQLEEKYARIQELEEEEKNRKYFPENVTIRFETNDGTVLGKTKMGGKEAKTLKALGVTGGLEANEPDYTTPIHLLAQALLENQLPVNINVSQAGWVNELNGLGGDVMYYINGADSSQMMGVYPLEEGDDIVVIQCSNDGGKYTGFGYFGNPVDGTFDPVDMTEEVLIKTGSELTLRYSYKGWDSGNSYAAGANLYISGNGLPTATEKLDATTDENGYATISFPEAGTYVVSARAFVKAGDETSGRLASNAYCRVTVTDTGEPEPEPLKGDMNGDGKLTLVDAIQLLDKVTAGDAVDTELADVNGDGVVTLADAIALLDLVTAEID